MALPSAALNLAVLAEGALTSSARARAVRALGCEPNANAFTQDDLVRSPEQWDSLRRCSFPGADLFGLVASFDFSRKEVESTYRRLTRDNGWTSDYNVRHAFSSPARVAEVMRASVDYLPSSLHALRTQFNQTLLESFDRHTAAEWMEQNLSPLEEMVDDLEEKRRKLMSGGGGRGGWPRRPLPDITNDPKEDDKTHAEEKDVVQEKHAVDSVKSVP